MQSIINQITNNLIGLINLEKTFYTPNDLKSAKIPNFVVERIQMALEDKVGEELGNPTSNWFDFNSQEVTETWISFRLSAISCSHIAKEKLREVIQNVVSDILNVFIEPRKKMASYIFRDEEELSLEEIELRCNRLTIYKHFGVAIPLYMRKRGLEFLSKEKCKQIIQQIDAKIVAAYGAEEWALKLEQLFVLLGNKVDTQLLSTFFEDKGLLAMAKKFSEDSKTISKNDFIKILSAKNEKIKPNFFTNLYAQNNERSELNTSNNSDHTKSFDNDLDETEMSDLLHDIAGDGVVEGNNEHFTSLNELFKQDVKFKEESVSETTEEIAAQLKQNQKNDPEEIKEFRENLISILDEAKHSFKSISKEEELGEGVLDKVTIKNNDNNEDVSVIDPNASKQENEIQDHQEDEAPIWAQFLDSDQMDTIMGGERSQNRINYVNDTDHQEEVNSDDTVFENNELSPTQLERIVNIQALLEPNIQHYIREIFSADEQELNRTINTLSTLKNWEEASDYIKNEIFTKNNVDLLSEITVDFTDRMQHFFNSHS